MNISYPNNKSMSIIDVEMVSALLPKRGSDTHKGSFGRLVVIAGSRQYTGAAKLAIQAALRSGVGLVYSAIPEPIYPPLAASVAEAIWLTFPSAEGAISANAVRQIPELLDKKTAVLIGPGLSQTDGTRIFLFAILERLKRDHPELPLVLDADALNLLSATENWHELLPKNCLLTPHEVEFSRLTGLEPEAIKADRAGMAEKFARAWKQTLILKGANTLVASPDGQLRVLPFANSVLAHGGSGDVLAGLTAGLLAQGLTAFDAATLAVWLHARAAELALAKLAHPAATLPSDLITHLGLAMKDI